MPTLMDVFASLDAHISLIVNVGCWLLLFLIVCMWQQWAMLGIVHAHDGIQLLHTMADYTVNVCKCVV
jgi:hypothetical protein